MKKLLYLAASPRYARSKSREMGQYCLDRLKAKFGELAIDAVNLDSYALPPLTEDMTNARYKHSRKLPMTPGEELAWSRTEAEFRRFDAAELYLISTPMWNYNLPGAVKRYFDTITHPGLVFDYSPNGMINRLKGRPLLVIYASGSLYDTPATAPMDCLGPWLKQWNTMAGMRLTAINYGGNDLDVDHAAIDRAVRKQVDEAVAAL